jgi:hypothetical protein
MAEFRRCTPLIVVVALLLGTAVVASAQSPLTCFSTAVQETVRAEGHAELVGNVVITCTGGTPTALGQPIPQVNVQIYMNVNVNSRQTASGTLSEALLLVDEPGAATTPTQTLCNPTGASQGTPCSILGTGGTPNPYQQTGNANIFQGSYYSANSIIWAGVPIDAPAAGAQRIIRIVNIRVDANQLGTSSTTLIPQQVLMFITTTPNEALPISNPTLPVASVLTGLAPLTMAAVQLNEASVPVTSSTPLPLTFIQCVNHLNKLYSNTSLGTNNITYPDGTAAVLDFELRMTEAFPGAFKIRGGAGTGANELSQTNFNQNVPGVDYKSESGFYSNTLWGANVNPFYFGQSQNSYSGAGLASQGTRLVLKFTGLPTGLKMLATVKEITNPGSAGSPSTLGSTYSLTASLVADGNANGIGGTTQIANTTTVTASTGVKFGVEPVTISSTNTATLTYEITGTNPTLDNTLQVGFIVCWVSNTAAATATPGVGKATVGATFGPIQNVSPIGLSPGATVPSVPRFIDESKTNSTTAFVIAQCITDLLFPFVTNQDGFDTGISIANSSKDPYKTAAAAGTCTLNYYGNTKGGAPPAAQTTKSVAGGSSVTFSLSTGATGVNATPGFQGYIIAQCNFPFGHGYAFISDVGAQKLAEGYLAINLDIPQGILRNLGISGTQALGAPGESTFH